MSDLRQTPKWAKYLSNLGWTIVKLKKTFTHIKRLPFNFSYIKIPRPNWPLDLKTIDKIASQNNALLIKITPKITIDDPRANSINANFLNAGYLRDYWTLTIAKTSVVDLTRSKDTLLKSFSNTTRYNIGYAKRQGVKIIQSDDFNAFINLYKVSSKRKGFKIASYKDLKTRYQTFRDANKAYLLFAQTKDNNTVATSLTLLNTADKEAVYHIAAQSETHQNLKAPYLLVWEAMLLAKKGGCKTFDFDGIYDQKYRATKNWVGFTFFKRGFKGQEISYLGSYIKFYNPILRLLFSLLTLY
ncbi:hypothetical protein A3B45_04425 [Candidatus Daviesbacteria bacterium RIFCSPLOWO2_01_FULL_39_12]|uniref:BioF2-like acetyltransferase domain-containing protein n=1 Tax=Candidatus Daviesbacteria bacterium RIFCSPLOWO2_01_FULL_39_12 TaxID=1797785 RepID=A0A1F5KN83_9BACT|nr:MAG: hypothetical protein A3B45_04425 [Candidatus Daviesbacteria bacterium RIFCSPLOWO2_01_FULL_39_12]